MNKLKLIGKYFLTIFLGIIIYIVGSRVVIFAYDILKTPIPKQIISVDAIEKTNNTENNQENSEEIIKERTNILILGSDESGGLTDVIMVGTLNQKTNKVNIISIPRDTFIEFSSETNEQIKSIGNGFNTNYKLNGIYGLTGRKVNLVQKEVEELLNIKIDYYAIINLEAFRKIVDTVDGVEMTLTRDYYYYDPTQNLRINLKAGTQTLYGKEAEQLIRFRSDYAGGDVQRIEVQQEFMNAFFSQVLQKKAIVSNITSYISIFLEYVKTDFTIDNLPKYLTNIINLKGEDINFITINGTSKYIGELSYFINNEIETAKLVNEIFYSNEN